MLPMLRKKNIKTSRPNPLPRRLSQATSRQNQHPCLNRVLLRSPSPLRTSRLFHCNPPLRFEHLNPPFLRLLQRYRSLRCRLRGPLFRSLPRNLASSLFLERPNASRWPEQMLTPSSPTNPRIALG